MLQRICGRAGALVGVGLVGFALQAGAVDGVLEINQACASGPGCFAGDPSGFPVVIANPGSYRLTSDLAVTADKNGINVSSADDVTVDLNGFTIASLGGTGIARGIEISLSSNVEIRNGTIRDFFTVGVFALGGTGVEGIRILDIRALGNGSYGLNIEGDGARVEGCTASENGSIGIRVVGAGALVLHSVARFNTGVGLSVSEGGYLGNVLTENNGGNANFQTSSGTNLGHNLCGTALCP